MIQLFEEESCNETTLSKGVKQLLCCYGAGVWVEAERVRGRDDSLSQDVNHCFTLAPLVSGRDVISLDANGFLDIEKCFRFLEVDEDKDECNNPAYFSRAAYKLAPTFKECEKYLSEKKVTDFCLQYEQNLKWTGKEQLFFDCYEMLTQRCESRDILALLLLCTGIEQSLRNVFVLENKQCPMLLKDILASKEVELYIGKAAVQILQILLGPPISMNLRNVAWHGFLCEGEISPRYNYFLLILMASLGPPLSSKSLVQHFTLSRHYFPLSKVDCIRNSLQDLPNDSLAKIKKNVECSWVACARNRKLIQDVFDLHSEKKYGFSCVQGFPILEHALRRRFVKVNNCPHRLLTAEATTLYTTYEEILDCFLPNGQENKLISDLGEPFMDLLHDLLIYPSGPRARDRLGHGEADVYSTPPSLSFTIITCLCYLSVKGWDENNTGTTDSPIQDVIASVDRYESHFHPVTELKGKILALSLKSSKIHRYLRIDPDLQPWSFDAQPVTFVQDNATFHSIVPLLDQLLHHMDDRHELWELSTLKSRLKTPFENVLDIITDTLKTRVSTLHRWQNNSKADEFGVSESEIIGLMHRVVFEMSTALDQMEMVLEQRQSALDDRLLRSRQRDNTKRLVNLFPNIILAVNYQNLLWTWLFNLMNQPCKNIGPLYKKMQKFLKGALQLVENLRTYTSKDNNKWTKADEVLVTLVQKGVEFTNGIHI